MKSTKKSSTYPLALPIRPSEEALQLLVRARLMLVHALEHAERKTEFDSMIAVHGLDNTIEYLLHIIASHLDLEELTGKSFPQTELASLAGEINKALLENTGVRLKYMKEIKLLRKLRNLVQHDVLAPNTELPRLVNIVKGFMDHVLTNIFGLATYELRLSTAIDDKTAKQFIIEAERHIDNSLWLESVVASRNAFENERFNRVSHANISMALYPSIVHAKEKHDISSFGMVAIKDELELTFLGINDAEYRRFEEYLTHIPPEYRAPDFVACTVMQRPWQKEDAEFCYNYVTRTILKWQTNDKEQLYTIRKERSYKEEVFISDIKIDGDMGAGCIYIYEGGDVLRLFYTDLETKRKFEKVETNKMTNIRTISYVDDKSATERTETVHICGVYTFLATNSPERWGVVIWYVRA
jgi:hypothetical protein